MKVKVDFLLPDIKLQSNVTFINNPQKIILEENTILTDKNIVTLKKHGIDQVDINIYNQDNDYIFENIFFKNIEKILKNNAFDSLKEFSPYYETFLKKTNVRKYNMKQYMNSKYDNLKHIINVINMAVLLCFSHNSISATNEHIPINFLVQASALENIGLLLSDDMQLKSIDRLYSSYIKGIRNIYPSIPKNILKVYNPDFHSLYSYLLLKDKGFDKIVLEGILYHHEKYELSSGPLGVALAYLDDITSVKISKIIKLCDLYDLLLTSGKNNCPDNPFKNISNYLDKLVADGTVDPYWTNLLKSVLPVYQIGEKVILSDGTVGIVSEINPNNMLKPSLVDLDGNKIIINNDLDIVGIY